MNNKATYLVLILIESMNINLLKKNKNSVRNVMLILA